MNDRTLINPSRNRQTVVNGSAGVLPDFTGRTINDTYIADRTFEESSGEAVLYLCHRKNCPEKEYVIKIYRRKEAVSPAVMENLIHISSPHIAAIVDYGIIDGYPYVILPFYRRGSLAGRIFSPDFIRRIIVPGISAGLRVLHENNIVHRDIKPSNLMLTDDGTSVVIIDFGISTVIGNEQITQLDTLDMSPVYSAPETFTSACIRESDYYSMGITLYETATGRVPFAGSNVRESAQLSLFSKISFPKDFPEDLKQLITALTFKDLSNRLEPANPHRRWTYREINRWLAGEKLPTPGEYRDYAQAGTAPEGNGLTVTGGTMTAAGHDIFPVPYRFNNKNILSLRELVYELGTTSEEGKKHLLRGYLTEFFRRTGNQEAASITEDAVEKQGGTVAYFEMIWRLQDNKYRFWWQNRCYDNLYSLASTILASPLFRIEIPELPDSETPGSGNIRNLTENDRYISKLLVKTAISFIKAGISKASSPVAATDNLNTGVLYALYNGIKDLKNYFSNLYDCLSFWLLHTSGDSSSPHDKKLLTLRKIKVLYHENNELFSKLETPAENSLDVLNNLQELKNFAGELAGILSGSRNVFSKTENKDNLHDDVLSGKNRIKDDTVHLKKDTGSSGSISSNLKRELPSISNVNRSYSVPEGFPYSFDSDTERTTDIPQEKELPDNIRDYLDGIYKNKLQQFVNIMLTLDDTEEYRKNFRKEELDSLRIYFQSRVRDINFSAVDLRNFTSEQLLRYGIYVINSERSLSYTGKLLVSTISYSFMEWVRTNRVKRINALIFEDAPGEFFARTPFKEIYFNIFLSSNITSLTYLFSGCEELIRAPYINTCFVTGMYGMFDGCTRLKEIPVYNTSRVNCMSFMFANCSSLTAIPSLRTSEVADMNGMFSGCLSLKEVPAMDTGRVNNMSDMFCDCRELTAIPFLDTGSVISMNGMLSGCSRLKNIPPLDTGKVRLMESLFAGCLSLKEIPFLKTGRVTDMNGMFSNCESLTAIPLLDTKGVTSMNCMFRGCTKLQDIPKFNTAGVTDMHGMFAGCTSLQSVPDLDTGNVTDMSRMFENCSSLTSVPLLNTSSVTSMDYMFRNCESLEKLPHFNVRRVTGMWQMLSGTGISSKPAFLSEIAVDITDIYD